MTESIIDQLHSELKISTFDTETLISDPDNVRRHGERNHDALIRSIKRFGVRKPIVAHAGTYIVYAGNETLLCCLELGITRIPVAWIPKEVPEALCRAYALADNRTTELSEWDIPALKDLTAELEVTIEDFDIEDLGFKIDELEELIEGYSPEQKVEEDDFDVDAALEIEPVSQTGDLWHIGEHRLLCGDSTVKEDVERFMDGKKANMLFTSPPYAHQRDYHSEIGDWDELMQGVFSHLPMIEDGQILVNLGLPHQHGEWNDFWYDWTLWMQNQGYKRFGWYVWDQGPGLPGDWKGRLAPSFEFVFHFNRMAKTPNKSVEKKPESITPFASGTLRDKKGKLSNDSSAELGLQPTKIPDNVIRIMREKNSYLISDSIHPAMFPVRFPVFFLQTWMQEGDICYEPFSGSGTTLIACEQLSRKCFAIEISPQYVDVAVRRYVQYVGTPENVFCERDGEKLSYDELFGENGGKD